ncbi:hypothetical protein D3C87_1086490 [compost metagenome]|jgi:hypothetical protein|uniref:Uncharacterized protein n=1 Tax=Cupriavidus campinensis TaxID=151783 RepID=A0AAE9L3N7_9BURK|nr:MULTISPECIES: hypothetical protein [Cupriavidus]TSP14622.1 hypothetical protein FGG12_02970 [Cupriavidus campinensis]URF05280.1 hypothetical protein M5D45_05530 [Cupriavidus campinensis]CAG2137316.1 hypothetical protein LMG19282_01316 [Cupriavidus campinensis]
MHGATPPFSFLCTLAADVEHLAYHVAVSFRDGNHPTGVQFTSFVGTGRRSFAVRSPDSDLQPATDQTSERLCRIAIGQVLRDQLYHKTADGDHVLDLDALPWEGELKPVGAGNMARRPARRHSPV